MKRIAFVSLIVTAASLAWGDCQPWLLFYGGDFSYPGVTVGTNANGLANENDGQIGGNPYGAATYQNFVGGGNIWGMFTNNLSNLIPSSAYWEIRTGVSEGNGGNLIATGTATGNNFSWMPTGRSGFGYTEYQALASNLNIYLPSSTYWFAVVPQALSQLGRSFNSNTTGLNSVGTTIPNQQYFTSAFYDAYFINANGAIGEGDNDFPRFSSGLLSNSCRGGDGCNVSESSGIPEPSSLILLGSGLMGIAVAVRRSMLG